MQVSPSGTTASSSPHRTATAASASASSSSSVVPWTLDQIHANAPNWSLQGDAQLLAIMQGVSQRLERRCTATKANIDHMLLDLDRANLRLENTANKMLSLKNLQFIEARVQDEVDGSSNTASASTTSTAASGDAMAELTTVTAIRTAVDNGLSMLTRCYEKVTLDLDDDSDNDDDDSRQTRFVSETIVSVHMK